MSSVGGFAIAIVLIATGASAQNRMNGFGSAGGGHFGSRAILMRHHHPFYPGYGYYGLPFWYSDYYEPSEIEYPAPQPPPNPVPVMQVKAEPAPDPELLELRDGQWVRVTSFSPSPQQIVSAQGSTAQGSLTKPLPPAVLVFRDGHTEEVKSYSIIGQAIYTKADYWSTGAWTRTIQIADLDVPATLKQNEERGVKFELPSSPDEVIIRP